MKKIETEPEQIEEEWMHFRIVRAWTDDVAAQLDAVRAGSDCVSLNLGLQRLFALFLLESDISLRI